MLKLCTFFTFKLVGWLGRLGWSDRKNRIGCKAPYPSTTSIMKQIGKGVQKLAHF